MCIFKKKQKKEINITKDMTISELMRVDKKVERILMGFGMSCLHCPMAANETLSEAADAHGIDVEFLIKKIKESV